MALTQVSIDLDSRHIKTYATEQALQKALSKFQSQEGNDRFFVVRTPSGRWTALIQLDKSVGGYVGRYAGFVTI